MDTEQSGEVVEVSDSPQQETEIQKEVVSKVESPADTEAPAPTITANGDGEQVNGHSEVEVVNDVGTEEAEKKVEDDAKMEDDIPQEEPKEEPAASHSDKEGVDEDVSKDDDSNKPEQEEKQMVVEQLPVNEAIPEPPVAEEPVETPPPPKEEEKVVENVEVPKEKQETEAKEAEPKKEDKMAEGDHEKTEELKEKSDTVEAEVAPTTAAAETAAEDGKSEVKEPEEDPTPAAGSLAFAILEQDKTKDTFKTTRTLVVLRGLPGSGKTFLARTIAEAYKDQCSILSADDHDVKPGSADGYKAFDEAIVAKCSGESPSLIVVDDTNHTQDRLAHLGGIAKRHRVLAIFLEPKTEWSRDAAQLTQKTKRGLEQAKLEAMKKVHEEMSIPLYFGWFIFCTVQDQVREKSTNFLKALEALESFKKHISDFGGKEEEKEVDLEQYFKAKGTLHCTTKFTNYGKAEGAKEYTEKQVVQDMYSSVSELSLSALFVTPRTVGARVSLSEDQLRLWPDDGEKEAEPVVPGAATLPPGSRAHVTLGCAEGVKPIQTGFDLLQILLLQKDGQQGEQVDIDPGTLTYYGEGRWYLALKEPITAAACFSSAYKPKAPGAGKKEKKKVKCSIL